MIRSPFTFQDSNATSIHVYRWLPAEGMPVKAVVQIAHGMAETAARYERLALTLTANGYAVYANDHKGHGLTAATIEDIGYIGPTGFHGMLEDMVHLTHIIKQEHLTTPVFLLGHSMGSFLAQGYMQKYGTELHGVILSGTNGDPGPSLKPGIFLAKLIAKVYGERHQSKVITTLVFGSYNSDFKPLRTPFDWLSRDETEVNKYIIDPFCGTLFTASFFRDFFLFLQEIYQIQGLRRIPRQLPQYLFSGALNPVGHKSMGVKKLIVTYEELQLQDITYRFYEGGRHEMLNEINRDEVTQDLLAWLEEKIN
ncbi:MAG: alpha/beta fold hydrolase [Paenibacillaceae bacterium]